MTYEFSKNERLCSKFVIEKLFNEGKVIYEYPLKAFWLSIQLPDKVPVQSVINVSKKRFKRAVKRNLLKRRMREAFRLNKEPLYNFLESKNLQIALLILFNDNSLIDFEIIQKGMIKLLTKISNKIESSGLNNVSAELGVNSTLTK